MGRIFLAILTTDNLSLVVGIMVTLIICFIGYVIYRKKRPKQKIIVTQEESFLDADGDFDEREIFS